MSVQKFQDMYLRFTQNLARCGELTLTKEQIDGAAASLQYDVRDTCSDVDADQTLLIKMVMEDGWKIDSNELKTNLH